MADVKAVTADQKAVAVATAARAYAQAASSNRPLEKVQADLLAAVTVLIGKHVMAPA